MIIKAMPTGMFKVIRESKGKGERVEKWFCFLNIAILYFVNE